MRVIVALEVGTSKVVAAVAELRRDGSMTLLGVGESPAVGVRKGEIVEYRDAQTSIRQALANAEKETDAEIGEVYLLLTGAHIVSRTDMVRTTILNEDKRVSDEDIDVLSQLSQNLVIPRDYVIVHPLLQHYRLDHGVVSREPVGLITQNLEGYYHLIYGLKTRLQTTVRCVADLGIEVCGYSLASYAMADAILTPENKEAGALAIDFGAGVTNYIVYSNGSVVHTGVIGLGGDHLTQDLSLGLRLSYMKAERLKRGYGDLFMDGHHADERILIEKDLSSEERHVYRDSMVKILQARQSEILSLIAEDIDEHQLWPRISSGVYMTGGASQMRGIERMGREIFSDDVHLVHEHRFLDGDQTYIHRPDLSSVFGLLKYAHHRELQSFQNRGWQRIRESIMSLLHAMKLF